ncbi:MAG: hypothetical protein R3C01_13185 [Planctomycetaceae bacterium]
MRSFFGNHRHLVAWLLYLGQTLGPEGLKAMSEHAVLNANYLKEKLRDVLIMTEGRCMHEFVASAKGIQEGVRAMDIAKRLLDYGFHAPTVYFPLDVPEAMMMEPTETEAKATLDLFADAIRQILTEDAEYLHNAPHTTPVSRPDEVKAGRTPIFRWGIDCLKS